MKTFVFPEKYKPPVYFDENYDLSKISFGSFGEGPLTKEISLSGTIKSFEVRFRFSGAKQHLKIQDHELEPFIRLLQDFEPFWKDMDNIVGQLKTIKERYLDFYQSEGASN